MSEVAYEPIIVTTLRRYVRRGASGALLQRIAGGAWHWRVVNETWDIDGTARLVAGAPGRARLALDEDLPELCTAERRIVLEQLAGECVETGASFPTLHELADYFGVPWTTVDNDLQVLRRGGSVEWSIEKDCAGTRRRIGAVSA